jgi:L-ascorbate metabolism protein UlaG (beta-lactamase superfamily)
MSALVMKPMHMNPSDAACAHWDLGCKQSIAMHFGTFQLTTEPFDQPLVDLKRALAEHGVLETEFVALPEGESRIFRKHSA